MFSFLAVPWVLVIVTCIVLLKSIVEFFLDRKYLRRFHPLTPLCAFTDLAYLIHNAKARSHGLTRTEAPYEAHKQHRVVRLGANRLSFADLDAIREIYGTSTKCSKGDMYTTPGGTATLLTVVDKQWHAVKRKRLSAAFATSHLLDWEYKVADKVERLRDQLDRHADITDFIDFRFWSNLFTLDAIMDIALSHHSGFLEAAADIVKLESGSRVEESVSLLDGVRSGNRANEPIVWSAAWFPTLKAASNLIPGYRQRWKLVAKWQDIVQRCVHRRMDMEEEGQGPDDLFSCLLRDGKGRGNALEDSEILAEVGRFCENGLR